MARKLTDPKVHIRWMIRRDMPDVLAIENGSFATPWTEEDFLKALRLKNCIGMVAELGERIVGYMIYELHTSSINVVNFAVHPGYRRREVGRRMVEKLVAKLSTHRRTRLTLHVRESNLPAQKFFKATGFKAVKVVRDFYGDGEDAYKFRISVADEPGEQFVPVNRIANLGV